MKRILAIVLTLGVLLCTALCAVPALAADATDEILLYKITVDVNQDGTLTMVYHIDWKVLDDDELGPLEWVRVGIPNGNYVSMRGLNSAANSVKYISDNGSEARIDLDRKYYEDEVASFEFELIQDYMYEMNRFNEGETYYEFTPGWFPDIAVDKLIIEWNIANAKSASPASIVENGYYTWETSLEPGERFKVSVTYPNDAFGFDATKTIAGTDDYNGGGYEYSYSSGGGSPLL